MTRHRKREIERPLSEPESGTTEHSLAESYTALVAACGNVILLTDGQWITRQEHS